MQLDSGLGKVRLCLPQIGGALLGVGAILRALLLHLVAEVVVLGLGIADDVGLLGGIEERDDVAFFDLRPVGDELGQREGSALTPDLRHQDLRGVHRFHHAGEPHFALGPGACLEGRQ